MTEIRIKQHHVKELAKGNTARAWDSDRGTYIYIRPNQGVDQ